MLLKVFIFTILLFAFSSAESCKTLDYGNGKRAFDGVYVKVDSLGNVCTKESGEWRYFFPVCIYSDKQRDHNYTAYSVDGRFNCMIAWNASNLGHIKDAQMKGILDTDPYQEGEALEGKLSTEIQKIKKQGLMNSLLFYYTDYERKRIDAWQWHKEKQNILAKEDPKGHPHYYLNGHPWSVEKIYKAKKNISDILGTYVYERWNQYRPNGPKQVIQLESSLQNNPLVMAQLNYGVGGDKLYKYPKDPIGKRFTPIAMASVAQGAKGIAFWKDYGSTKTSIEDNIWWNDLPKFNADIKKMMQSNIIQSLHNPFSIICDSHYYRDKYYRKILLDNIYKKDSFGYYLIPDDDLSVSVGSRLVNGKGYAIISNWNSSSQNFECSVNTSQMGYSFSRLYNFIDDKDGVGSVFGSRFKITVDAYSWVVLKFL